MTVETALLAAFAAELGPLTLVRHRVTPWLSATFAGGRHVFEVAPEGLFDVDAFARIIAEQDIPISRGFVADVAIAKDEVARAGAVVIEVLTIDA